MRLNRDMYCHPSLLFCLGLPITSLWTSFVPQPFLPCASNIASVLPSCHSLASAASSVCYFFYHLINPPCPQCLVGALPLADEICNAHPSLSQASPSSSPCYGSGWVLGPGFARRVGYPTSFGYPKPNPHFTLSFEHLKSKVVKSMLAVLHSCSSSSWKLNLMNHQTPFFLSFHRHRCHHCQRRRQAAVEGADTARRTSF